MTASVSSLVLGIFDAVRGLWENKLTYLPPGVFDNQEMLHYL